MASEARVSSSLQIDKDNLHYRPPGANFQATVTGQFGPTPGGMTVSLYGTIVDLSKLTVPGFCRIVNYGAAGYIEYGIVDPETGRFYPLGEVQAGESYVLRLSRNLRQEYGTGVGTGTLTGATNQLMLRASPTECKASVEAFEA
jgi:hypothetical protein